jgi:hypothetical protein
MEIQIEDEATNLIKTFFLRPGDFHFANYFLLSPILSRFRVDAEVCWHGNEGN